MKRLLLAGLATGALALAAPVWAQTTDPLPASPPPVEQPEATPDVTQEELVGPTATQEQPIPAAPSAGELAAAPEASPAPAEVAQAPVADAQVAAAPEASPSDSELAAVQPAPAPMTGETPAQAMPASAQAVCQPRVTSVHFGQRGAALTRENRNAIEYAVDAASVCNLEQVTITDSAEGRTSDRRTETVRATLIERGVPADNIVVAEEAASEGAATGQLDVRMTFAGVATAETPVASLEGAEAETAG